MVFDTGAPFMRGVAEVLMSSTHAPSGAVDLNESVAVCTGPGVRLSEVATLAADPGSDTVWLIQLIAADVQGSSGYYPADVLRRDGPRIFTAGTHVYLDHPTATEETDRPERSVRDLAGVLIEDAYYDDGPNGKGLFARMRVFSDHAHRVAELAPHVGMSIRARGTKEYHSDTNREVVSSLIDAQSVDIVTHAGAGGRFLQSSGSAGW